MFTRVPNRKYYILVVCLQTCKRLVYPLNIMCLYPIQINNKRYCSTVKNKGVIPMCPDERLKKVYVPCGKCIECRRQKSRDWRFRLEQEYKSNNLHCSFVTLTFSNESLDYLLKKYQLQDDCNAVATIAVRLFLERYRKKYKVSMKHFLVTELGHSGTERIHLHGLLWSNNIVTNEDLFKFWRYGLCDVGQYVNYKSINYITKYITKVDKVHPLYYPICLVSPGLGSSFLNSSFNRSSLTYKDGITNFVVRTKDGSTISCPKYYKAKVLTDEEKEQVFLNNLNSKFVFILGNKILKDSVEFSTALRVARELNDRCGYSNYNTFDDLCYYNYKVSNMLKFHRNS